MNIEKRIIDKVNPTYFIADIAANHDGDLSRAIDLIYMAAEAGADAAKFQHFQAETIVSNRGFESLGEQMSHQAKWKRSVYEVYKDASVNLDWTETLVAACKKAGITFFTTPYSLEVVDYLDDYVPAYKIGSGDISWPEMIKKVASKNKPYFIATGASRLDEVVAALSFAEPMNNNLCIMQCNTNYTASLENFKYINLNVLKIYEQLFPEICLGLSDHTPGHATVLGAVTLGARAIEKHFTDSNERTGPDHAFSMDPKSWKEMVLRTRELEFSLGTGVKQVEENEKDTVILQRRAMRATRSIRKGEIIKKSDFYPLRPCPEDAAHLMNLSDLEGFRVSRDFANGDYIKYGDIYKPYD
jgi:sialic acid synthase SpsE